MSGGGPLGLRDDALAACVRCGLCLPHCPTYRVSGDESRSPRGRIALMRAAEAGTAALDAEWFEAMDTCVQCLGCETACPSGVPYGELIVATREATVAGHRPSRRLRAGLWLLGRPRLLRIGSRLLALVQRVGLVPRTGLLPRRLPLWAPRSRATGTGDVVLFTGCVMDAWQPEVHAAVEAVLEEMGTTVERSGDRAGCCGALHEHAGLGEEARRSAERVMAALPGDRPILVDSAGCGAALKRYGHLLGTPVAEAFAARVLDVHEWLAPQMGRLPTGRRTAGSVIVHDPCHLRHAQGCHGAVRDVLQAYMEVVELDDEGLCCGAGGAYSLSEPALADEVRQRKVAAIRRAAGRSGTTVVVSANPGCTMHLVAAGVDVRHPMELLSEALREDPAEVGIGESVDDAG